MTYEDIASVINDIEGTNFKGKHIRRALIEAPTMTGLINRVQYTELRAAKYDPISKKWALPVIENNRKVWKIIPEYRIVNTLFRICDELEQEVEILTILAKHQLIELPPNHFRHIAMLQLKVGINRGARLSEIDIVELFQMLQKVKTVNYKFDQIPPRKPKS